MGNILQLKTVKRSIKFLADLYFTKKSLSIGKG